MSEMVERIAKAIDDVSTAGMKNRTDKQLLEMCARAAIAAMREPTKAMIEAGGGAVPMDEDFWQTARECWVAMIDAALEMGPPKHQENETATKSYQDTTGSKT